MKQGDGGRVALPLPAGDDVPGFADSKMADRGFLVCGSHGIRCWGRRWADWVQLLSLFHSSCAPASRWITSSDIEPTPSVMISTLSPPRTGPTPGGVPEAMMSPGVQRHDGGCHADHVRDVDDQVACAGVLLFDAIHCQAQLDVFVRRHFIGRHVRADRAEGVVGLPHHVLFLAAYDDVDQAGIAEHVFHRIFARDIASALADDDGQFAFIMDLAVGDLRQHDRVVRSAQAGIGLQEESLAIGLEGRNEAGAVLHFLVVRMIIGWKRNHLVGPWYRCLEANGRKFAPRRGAQCLLELWFELPIDRSVAACWWVAMPGQRPRYG
jgi:hypothetical protein